MTTVETDRVAAQAETIKEEGNALFKENKYVEAVDRYLKAIDLNPNVVSYFTNAAAAFALINEHERAVEMAHRAVELCPGFAKAYYRRGVSLMALGEYKRALKDLGYVAKATPDDINVRQKLKECEKLNMQQAFAAALHVDSFDLDQTAVAKLDIPETYKGPRLDDFGAVPPAFVAELLEWYKLEYKLAAKVVYMILCEAKRFFEAQPNLVRVGIPEGTKLTVCGDIHGQFFDLLHIFQLNGFPSKDHYYLFNGDFVDRGANSVEVIVTLLSMKLAYPDFFFLSRGNHESESINRMHGFMEEATRKYDLAMFTMTNKVFNTLPLAHLVQGKIFVVHGGLPSKADFVLADLDAIDRFQVPPNGSMFSQLLWSDPKQTNGIAPSHRGEGILWGPDVTEAFLERNGLALIIRSHVWEPAGYKVDHGGQCVTIFSAPNYTGAQSPAALMNIDHRLDIEYRQFEASALQGKAATTRRPTGM